MKIKALKHRNLIAATGTPSLQAVPQEDLCETGETEAPVLIQQQYHMAPSFWVWRDALTPAFLRA